MRKLVFALLLLCSALFATAQEWQWSVQLKGFISSETGKEPTAFLWIPSDCHQLRAVMVGKHNMSEETLFEMPRFREALSRMGIGLVWITPGIDQQWDVTKGTQEIFNRMMNDLAEVSGYSELEHIPVVPVGHSAMATYPWNFAAWNPERTLAVISLHGDAPRTNLCGYGGENLEWGRTRNIDGIPGLMIEGEYEWWEARVNPALAFRMMYPESCISFLCDTGRGHFDVAGQTADYIALFLRKALEYRLSGHPSLNEPVRLKKLNPEEGWLAERWRPEQKDRAKAAPYRDYKGDKHDAFWYFDKEMAGLTEARYAKYKGKQMQYLGFMQRGRLVKYDAGQHAGVIAAFRPDPKRTGDIWLLAANEGDSRYKSAVQQFNIRIPYRNTEGKRQYILFPGIEDVREGVESVSLEAVSDCGLPIYYYVKEGPAELQDNRLVFTKIPPRSKFPVKVTVVAWQYGIAGQVQTAEPVERSFFITK